MYTTIMLYFLFLLLKVTNASGFAFVRQAITGDAVLAKFEKARCSLEASLICVEDIVSQSIGFQVKIVLFHFFFSFLLSCF